MEHHSPQGQGLRVRGPTVAVTNRVTSCKSLNFSQLNFLISKVGIIGLLLVWDKVTMSKVLREMSHNRNYSINVNRNY